MRKRGGIGAVRNFIQENKSVLEPAYETSAIIGKAYAIFSAIGGTLLLLIFLFIGIWLVRMHRDKTASTSGTVIKSTCNSSNNKCIVEVEYTVNNKKYTLNYESSTIVNKGQTVKVYYDPKNPNNFVTGSTNKVLGWIFIGIAIIGIILAWASLIFTLFFKPVAAATGVGAIVDAVTPNNE